MRRFSRNEAFLKFGICGGYVFLRTISSQKKRLHSGAAALSETKRSLAVRGGNGLDNRAADQGE